MNIPLLSVSPRLCAALILPQKTKRNDSLISIVSTLKVCSPVHFWLFELAFFVNNDVAAADEDDDDGDDDNDILVDASALLTAEKCHIFCNNSDFLFGRLRSHPVERPFGHLLSVQLQPPTAGAPMQMLTETNAQQPSPHVEDAGLRVLAG